jgi:hypothetical protein
MEFVEYLPGALAAGWMVVRLAILVRNGQSPVADEQNA